MNYADIRPIDVANGPGVRTSIFVAGCTHHCKECFNPETGELMLGDIMISVDKVEEQAEKYGHSTTRELAFLVAHSMLHLCGYDHMEDEERLVMEAKQNEILEGKGYCR